VSLDLNNFNPDYPKNPKTLGEQIRKVRMDRNMTAKELAAVFGVSDTAVLNWKIKGMMPDGSRMEKIGLFLAG